MTPVTRHWQEMQVDIDATSTTVRVAVRGHCTGASAPTLLSALDAACRSHPRRVIVDLSSTLDIDGEAMAALLAFRRGVPDTVITIDIRAMSGSRLMALMADAETHAA